MFNCTPVFYSNFNSKAKIVINQGGTSSSKTFSIMQLLYYRAMEKRRVITVTGESIPNLKKGAYRDAETIYALTPQLKEHVTFWNRSDRIISFKNGSIIEFISNLDEQSAKNGKRDILFVNEANGISYLVFWQLAIRTRGQIFIDYNPSAPFFAHEKLIGTTPDGNDLGATVELIISDHRHNSFLSEDEHAKIEAIKDKNLWRVYARGKTGNLEGLIYPNWRQIPDVDYPWNTDFIGGLDFGYTNDASCGTRVCRVGDSIFIHELFYEPGLGPVKIKELFFANGFTSNTHIYCDHDKEQIALLRRTGLTSALPALKGPGSIKSGILLMNDYKVFYTASSKNLHEERIRYMWMKDPVTGKSLNEPKGGFDHALDSARMACYSHYHRVA